MVQQLQAESDNGFEDHGFEWPSERWGEIPIMADAKCYMFFGKRGSGKSALMAKCGRDEYAAGKKVWYWPKDYMFKYGEYIDAPTLYSLPEWLKDGVILIDEFQVLMNRLRTVSTANIMGGTMLQQLRKRGLNVYGTSNQPGRLDQSVAEHTDIHFFCELIKDQRCYKRGKHSRSCNDHVRTRFVDTNRAFGHDPHHRDGRRRGMAVWWKIRDAYLLYNTGAIADMVEVMSVNKEAILQARDDAATGMTRDELLTTLRTQWIPWAIGQGIKSIAVAGFAAKLNESFGLNITSQKLGMALKDIGLKTKSDGRARVFDLPPKDKLAAWIDGEWSQD